jgi:hypothetical protein
MAWNVICLIGGIATLVLGVFSLMQKKHFFLSLAGIVWFLVVLFNFFVANVYNFILIQGVPSLGNLLLFIALPVFIVLSFFSRKG